MRSLAEKIVHLLEQDPGVIGLFGACRGVTVPEEPEEIPCRGCRELFTPRAVGRQYCSRDCYDRSLLERRKKRTKPKPRARVEGDLGPGRRFEGEPAQYAKSRQGLATVYEVRQELFDRFGLRVGITTIYRAWKRRP